MIGFTRNYAKTALQGGFLIAAKIKNAFKSRGADVKTVNYGCRKR